MSRFDKLKYWIINSFHQPVRWRPILAFGLGGLVFIQILAFNPSRLEEEGPASAISEESLLPKLNEKIELSAAIPKDRVPEYTIEGFQYTSTQGGKKIWRLDSDHAFFYQPEGIVHTQVVRAEIYDSAGQTTVATALEAKYDEKRKDLEMYGDVVVTFPSGLVIRSPFALYRIVERDVIVPNQHRVEGENKEKDEVLRFASNGMKYDQNANLITLNSAVRADITKVTGELVETTTITSDYAIIDKNKNIARFQMLDTEGAPTRFVQIDQPRMKAKGRKAEFYFASARSEKTASSDTAQSKARVKQMRLVDEVKIEEEPRALSSASKNPRNRGREVQKRYSTSGIAEFDARKNIIILKQYPQVYQGRDTMTGETIIVHRDSDIVEVEQSNAYSDGTDDEDGT